MVRSHSIFDELLLILCLRLWLLLRLPEFDGCQKSPFPKEMGSIEKDRLCQQLKKDVRGSRDTWRVNEILESNVPDSVSISSMLGWNNCDINILRLALLEQGCRFVPYPFLETMPQMVLTHLSIGFQGLALIQGQIYNPEEGFTTCATLYLPVTPPLNYNVPAILPFLGVDVFRFQVVSS